MLAILKKECNQNVKCNKFYTLIDNKTIKQTYNIVYLQTKICYNKCRKRKEEKGMLNYEKYREIQTELSEQIKDGIDVQETVKRYCKENELIIYNDFIFDDWNNTIVLRLIDDMAAGVHIHLVELPFEVGLHRRLKEGRGK